MCGARKLLVAFNINVLGTKNQAHRIALNVRTAGRGPKEPGRLQELKAIGWYVDEYDIAQISCNLTDYHVTNMHTVYEECEKDAKALNIGLCGGEIVGLINLECILDVADYYIKKENLFILEEKQKEFGTSIYIISDEPYRELAYDGANVPWVPDFYRNTIVGYSWSKSLSLPGERIGYVAVNPACKEAETLIAMCAQISRGIGHNCPPSIIQLAVAQVLDKTADLSVYEVNRNLLYNELIDLGYTCVKPGGTFYIFPKAMEEDAREFCKKALKYDLILVPGDTFGAPGYFRMAYCVDTEKVKRSLTALRQFTQETYPNR